MSAGIERALERLRPMLDADGFSLRLDRVDPDGTVRVVLEATPEACLDCLVPDEVLMRIIQESVQKEQPDAGPVVLAKEGF